MKDETVYKLFNEIKILKTEFSPTDLPAEDLE